MSLGSAEMTCEDLAALLLAARRRPARRAAAPRLRRQRQRDLEQPLPAVGELRGRPVACLGQVQLLEDRVRLVDRVGERFEAAPNGMPPIPRRWQTTIVTASIGVRCGKSVLIWNVRAKPALHPPVRLERA